MTFQNCILLCLILFLPFSYLSPLLSLFLSFSLSLCLSVSMSFRLSLSVCLSVSLSLSLCLFVYLSLCLSLMFNLKNPSPKASGQPPLDRWCENCCPNCRSRWVVGFSGKKLIFCCNKYILTDKERSRQRDGGTKRWADKEKKEKERKKDNCRDRRDRQNREIEVFFI